MKRLLRFILLGLAVSAQAWAAIHPWNGPTQFSTSATNTFTASATNSVLMSYDQAGNVITNSHGIGITQTLTWDVAGRLINVSERNAETNRSDFTAVYDPLGRRLKTEDTPVSVGVPITSLKRTADSCYDPQIEFLETGVSLPETDAVRYRLEIKDEAREQLRALSKEQRRNIG